MARHPLELALSVKPDHAPAAAKTEPLLVVLVGPTGSGKTALSLSLALSLARTEGFHGEIVNCDSVAMVREFEIGTAKPTPAERERVPHHLFDVVDATGYVTAGQYARQARQILHEIVSRKRLPIVVGGTGLYLRALLDGLFPGPERSEQLRERLRERAIERGSGYLHRILISLDQTAAEKIHANDTPKIIRAIEVCLTSPNERTRKKDSQQNPLQSSPQNLRNKMSELWRERGRDPLRGFRILRLGLDPERELLYARINQRARRMFDDGLVEETQALLAKYGEEARPLSALGYKQARQFLAGELTREQAIVAAQQAHRNYAKRQMTWFRAEPDVIWLKGFGDDDRVRQEALRRVAALEAGAI